MPIRHNRASCYLDLDKLKPTAISLMHPGWLNAIVNHQVAAGMRNTQFKPFVPKPELPPGGRVGDCLDIQS